MKTTKLFRLVFLLIAVSMNVITLNAQSAYLDAVKLRNDAQNNNGKFSNKTDSILNRYDISRYDCSNSFLNPYIEPYEVGLANPGTTRTDEQKNGDASKNNVVNFFSSLGGLDVTTVADGFAKFIVKRTKQELSIAFFDQFKQELDSLNQLQIIFPQTYMVLSSIGNDIYMYEAYIHTLKASFTRDLATLPSNLPQLVYNNKIDSQLPPKYEAMLLSAFYFAQSIQTNQHPGMIIENYPVHYLDSIDKNVKASFQIVQLISKSLRNDSNNYWITTQEANELLSDPILFKIYLGLVMQQSKIDNVVFADGASLYDNMNKTKYNDYSQYIYTFIAKSQQLESLIKSINKQQKDSLLFEKYYTTAFSIIDLMRFTAKGVDVWIPKNGKMQNWEQTTKDYFDVSQTTINLAIDINRKDYSSAIVNTASILKSAFRNSKDSLTAQQIIKYGTFMALVAQAKNSEEVEAAIESIALPTGSARVKRESKWNVALNAYCGVFWGSEKIKSVDNRYSGINFTHWNSYGITTPIGFSFSNGKQHAIPFSSIKKYNGHWSHSIFISIIDIGALAAFRFNNANDSVSSVPKITLGNIFSPGVFYSIGIPKSPISINLGYQFGPLLRKVESASNTIQNEKYTRFSVSVCVDLPILNLYNKTK